MRLPAIITHDIRFQLRHGFYYAYLLLTIIYIAILWFVPAAYRDYAVIFVIFSDPCGLGFFFVGGLILLEKDQNTYDPLFVTPASLQEFLIAKVISLSILAVATSVGIALFGVGLGQLHLLQLVLAVLLSSICFTFLGITLAVRVRTLNQYMIGAMLYSVLFLPILQYLGILHHPLFSVMPTLASLQLISASLGQGAFSWFSLAVLLGWIIISYTWSYAWFRRYIIEKMGD